MNGKIPGGTVKERLIRIETQGESHVETLKNINSVLMNIATTFTKMKEDHCTPNERDITALTEQNKSIFARFKVIDYVMAGVVLTVIGTLLTVFVGG